MYFIVLVNFFDENFFLDLWLIELLVGEFGDWCMLCGLVIVVVVFGNMLFFVFVVVFL